MSGTNDSTALVLPPTTITKTDIARLIAELERLDSDLITRDVHIKIGTPITEQLVLSDQLTDFLHANELEIGDGVERTELIQRVRHLKESAPTVHITFAAPADIDSLRQIAHWLRQSVHPQSIIVVGLQPSLIGGVYIRTPNQAHDFSLRSLLSGHRDLIIKEVEAIRGGN